MERGRGGEVSSGGSECGLWMGGLDAVYIAGHRHVYAGDGVRCFLSRRSMVFWMTDRRLR